MTDHTGNGTMRDWQPAGRLIFLRLVLVVLVVGFLLATIDVPDMDRPSVRKFQILVLSVVGLWGLVYPLWCYRLQKGMLVSSFQMKDDVVVEGIEGVLLKKKIPYTELSLGGSLPRFPIRYAEILESHHHTITIRVARSRKFGSLARGFSPVTLVELGPVDVAKRELIEELKKNIDEALEARCEVVS